MPALDLKCITKLKAMQQRSIAAFEGHFASHWSDVEKFGFLKSLYSTVGWPLSEWFFSIHMMSNGQDLCVKAKNLFLSIKSLSTRTVEQNLANCTSTMSMWLCASNPCTPCPTLPSWSKLSWWGDLKVCKSFRYWSEEKIQTHLRVWDLYLY